MFIQYNQLFNSDPFTQRNGRIKIFNFSCRTFQSLEGTKMSEEKNVRKSHYKCTGRKCVL